MRMKQVVSLLGFRALTTYATACTNKRLRTIIVGSWGLALKYR
jgi:hypothetical protein